MKVRKFLIIGLTSLLLISGAQGTQAQDATKPMGDPQTLQQSLSKSIAVFKCSSGTGLGFIGNYNISTEARLRDINSYFVTSFQNLLNCRFETWDSITAFYNGEQRVAQMLLNNGDSSDYAVVSTSFSGPAINLYDSTIPQKGWWVLVAQYSPEGVIEWTVSAISSIDISTFTFYIDGKNIVRQSGGLVFDNLGHFLGLIPSKVPQTTDQKLLVSGAPLQCPAKLFGATTTTSCTLNGLKVFREDIWTKPLIDTMPAASPSSIPKPTVTPLPLQTVLPTPSPRSSSLQSTPKPTPKRTLICTKGKASKKIISLNPKCPPGWKYP